MHSVNENESPENSPFGAPYSSSFISPLSLSFFLSNEMLANVSVWGAVWTAAVGVPVVFATGGE